MVFVRHLFQTYSCTHASYAKLSLHAIWEFIDRLGMPNYSKQEPKVFACDIPKYSAIHRCWSSIRKLYFSIKKERKTTITTTIVVLRRRKTKTVCVCVCVFAYGCLNVRRGCSWTTYKFTHFNHVNTREKKLSYELE